MSTDEPQSVCRAPGALAWYKVDELNAEQVAAMQSLDDARRAGLVADDDAEVIERVIRDGHPHGARKRLTEAKRRNGYSLVPGDLVARLRWMSEHDRAALVELLRTLDRECLRVALGPACPDSAAPTEPGHAHTLGKG